MDVGKLKIIEPLQYNEIYSVHTKKKMRSKNKIKLPKLESLTEHSVKSNNFSQKHHNLTQRESQIIYNVPEIIPYPVYKPNNIYKNMGKKKKYFKKKELSYSGIKEIKLLKETKFTRLDNLYESIPLRINEINDYINKEKNQFINYVQIPNEVIDFVNEKISNNNKMNKTSYKTYSNILNIDNEKGKKLIIHNVFFEMVMDKIFRLIELHSNKTMSIILVKNLLNNEFEEMKKTLIEMDKSQKLNLNPKSLITDKKIKNKLLITNYSNYNEFMNYSNNNFNEKEKYITDMLKKKFFNNSSYFSTDTTNITSNFIFKISNEIENNLQSFRNKNYSSVFENDYEDQLISSKKNMNEGLQELIRKMIEGGFDKNRNSNKRFKGINFNKKDYNQIISLYKKNLLKDNGNRDNLSNLIGIPADENAEILMNFIIDNCTDEKMLTKENLENIINEFNKNGKNSKLKKIKDINKFTKLFILNNINSGKNKSNKIIKDKNTDINRLSGEKNKNKITDLKKMKNYTESNFFNSKNNKNSEINTKLNNNDKDDDSLINTNDFNNMNNENNLNKDDENLSENNNNILTETELLSQIKSKDGKIDIEDILNKINKFDNNSNKNIDTNMIIQKLISESEKEVKNNNFVQINVISLELNEMVKAELNEKEVNFIKETDNLKKVDQKYKFLLTKLFNQLLKYINGKKNNKKLINILHSLIDDVIKDVEKERINQEKSKKNFRYKTSKNIFGDKNHNKKQGLDEKEKKLIKNNKIYKNSKNKYKYRSSNGSPSKKLIYDNSYLFKKDLNNNIKIKQEILDIINSEYKPIKEENTENKKFDIDKTLSQKTIKTESDNRQKIKKQYTLLEIKNDLESSKNIKKLSEEEEKRKMLENLNEQKLYDFFRKIQILKKGTTSEDNLNLETFIDDELNKKISTKDIQRELRANSFLQDLSLSRKKSIYSNAFMKKKIRFMSPLTFASTVRNKNKDENKIGYETNYNFTDRIPEKKYYITNYGDH